MLGRLREGRHVDRDIAAGAGGLHRLYRLADIDRRQEGRAEQPLARGGAEVRLPAVVGLEAVEIERHVAGLQRPAAEHHALVDAVVVHVLEPLVEHPAAHPHVGDLAVVRYWSNLRPACDCIRLCFLRVPSKTIQSQSSSCSIVGARSRNRGERYSAQNSGGGVTWTSASTTRSATRGWAAISRLALIVSASAMALSRLRRSFGDSLSGTELPGASNRWYGRAHFNPKNFSAQPARIQSISALGTPLKLRAIALCECGNVVSECG